MGSLSLKSNLLINSVGEPQISDFGLSRMLTYSKTALATSSYGTPKGSTRWMAYELFTSENYEVIHTKASDMWAFGMTLFEVNYILFPARTSALIFTARY